MPAALTSAVPVSILEKVDAVPVPIWESAEPDYDWLTAMLDDGIVLEVMGPQNASCRGYAWAVYNLCGELVADGDAATASCGQGLALAWYVQNCRAMQSQHWAATR